MQTNIYQSQDRMGCSSSMQLDQIIELLTQCTGHFTWLAIKRIFGVRSTSTLEKSIFFGNITLDASDAAFRCLRNRLYRLNKLKPDRFFFDESDSFETNVEESHVELSSQPFLGSLLTVQIHHEKKGTSGCESNSDSSIQKGASINTFTSSSTCREPSYYLWRRFSIESLQGVMNLQKHSSGFAHDWRS